MKLFDHFRAGKQYWQSLKPSSGRPFSSAMSKPDCWGVTAGDKSLMQKKDATTEDELLALQQKRPVFNGN